MTEVSKVFCNCIVKILHNTKYKCLKLAILVKYVKINCTWYSMLTMVYFVESMDERSDI